ncbi:MAG: hypothetical protein U0289_04770 [Cyclobacteriaceae bacterium]|jgi:hypothetical protein
MDRVWIVYEGSSLFGVVFNRRDNQGYYFVSIDVLGPLLAFCRLNMSPYS